jgi:hypothetical protein
MVSRGSVTATIDGDPLAVDGVDVAYSAGNLSFSAVSDATPACSSLSILIWGDVVAQGPTTYNAGRIVPEVSAVYTLRSPRGSWKADATQGSGSLTVTTVTPTSVAGTFTFQMVPDLQFPGTTATRTKVSAGAFDLAIGSVATSAAWKPFRLEEPPNRQIGPTRH